MLTVTATHFASTGAGIVSWTIASHGPRVVVLRRNVIDFDVTDPDKYSPAFEEQ